MTTRLRICLLTPEFPPHRVGGVGAYIATLAAGLGGRGHAVDVVGCDVHPTPGTVVHPWGRSVSLPAGGHVLNGGVAAAADDWLRWLAHKQAPAVWRVYPHL